MWELVHAPGAGAGQVQAHRTSFLRVVTGPLANPRRLLRLHVVWCVSRGDGLRKEPHNDMCLGGQLALLLPNMGSDSSHLCYNWCLWCVGRGCCGAHRVSKVPFIHSTLPLVSARAEYDQSNDNQGCWVRNVAGRRLVVLAKCEAVGQEAHHSCHLRIIGCVVAHWQPFVSCVDARLCMRWHGPRSQLEMQCVGCCVDVCGACMRDADRTVVQGLCAGTSERFAGGVAFLVGS
jgi:hypothetical protein